MAVMTPKEIVEIVESIAPKYPSVINIGVFGSYATMKTEGENRLLVYLNVVIIIEA